MTDCHLPTGAPRLDALVRAEAEKRAEALAALLPYEQHHGPTTTEIAWAFEALLRDLTRPESRDWAARALAWIVGVEVGATAPTWTYSPAVRDSVASWYLRGVGHARWCLLDYPPDIEAVLGAPDAWVPGDAARIRNLPTDPAEALCLALVTVCRDA